MLRGTLPPRLNDEREQKANFIDPKGLNQRLFSKKPIYIDSWSETLNVASITLALDDVDPDNHWMSIIGIESAYRESSLREKYLGDGAVGIRESGSIKIIQSCLAQNVRGKSAGKDLEQEIIDRLNAKLLNSPNEPERILAVTVLSEKLLTPGFFDYSKIARETIGKYRAQSTYGPSFCVVPYIASDHKLGVGLVLLSRFLPGGNEYLMIIPTGLSVYFEEESPI